MNELDALLKQFEVGSLETDASKLDSLQGRLIYLYGAGNVGKRLYHSLKASGIEVAGFIDRNPSARPAGISVPVHLPNDPDLVPMRNSSIVILSGLFPLKVCNDIKENLTTLGFRHVHALHEINFSQVNSGAFRETLFDDSYNKIDILGADRPKLERAFGLLHGDEDRALFLSYLKAHLTMDFTRLSPPHDISLQYLAHDIPETKDYSCFIDCGGYDGDTFRQLSARGIQIRTLVAFEPQSDLYGKYAATLKAAQTPPEQAFLFPCGVYSETTQLRFASNDEAQSAARVSAGGDSMIQCVKLDEALQGLVPSFLKMDIEGAETAALQGARGLIEKQGPNLAICVYHGLSDLWEVPWLISSMRQDYRYYLRSYNYMGLETVLYAFRDPVAE